MANDLKRVGAKHEDMEKTRKTESAPPGARQSALTDETLGEVKWAVRSEDHEGRGLRRECEVREGDGQRGANRRGDAGTHP